MKYDSSTTYHSKDMTNVKVLADKQTDNGQTSRLAKNYMPTSIDAEAQKSLLKTILI